MMMNCHCSMCRKHHGAPFRDVRGHTDRQLPLAQRRRRVVFYDSSAHGKRGFCPTCGAVAPMVMQGADSQSCRPATSMAIRAFARRLTCSWARRRPGTTTDSLPQHAEYPPEFAGATSVQRPTPEPIPGKTTGTCLCGDIAYEIEGQPVAMYSVPLQPLPQVPQRCAWRELLLSHRQLPLDSRRVAGCELQSAAEALRFTVAFCKHCGGATPVASRERGIVIVPVAPLDSDPGMRPLAHIFVGSKAPWFEITDTLPRMEEGPPPPK